MPSPTAAWSLAFLRRDTTISSGQSCEARMQLKQSTGCMCRWTCERMIPAENSLRVLEPIGGSTRTRDLYRIPKTIPGPASATGLSFRSNGQPSASIPGVLPRFGRTRHHHLPAPHLKQSRPSAEFNQTLHRLACPHRKTERVHDVASKFSKGDTRVPLPDRRGRPNASFEIPNSASEATEIPSGNPLSLCAFETRQGGSLNCKIGRARCRRDPQPDHQIRKRIFEN